MMEGQLRRRLNRDTWIALFLLLFCGASYAATFNVRETSYASIGAEVWPRVIIALLTMLSLIYLLQSLVRAQAPATAGSREPRRGPRAWLGYYRNPILCFTLFGAFLVTLPVFGMLLGGALFVFAMLTVLGPRDVRALLLHLAIAVASVGGMWAVFTFALRVILPEGMIFQVW